MRGGPEGSLAPTRRRSPEKLALAKTAVRGLPGGGAIEVWAGRPMAAR
jgi:hypothetical protein